MSFFYDFLKYFDIKDIDAKTTITTIVGYGVILIGKIKIKNIDENEISIISNREKIMLYGTELTIKSISKGELVVAGKISKIETEQLWVILFV